MSHNEEYILGNPPLHLQLATALNVMTQIICNASRPPTAQQLSKSLEVSIRYLRKLLRTLTAGGLLKPHERYDDSWSCTRAPHTISLADLYHCLTGVEEESAPFVPVAQTGSATSSSELLMMQATMSINQLVLHHLQQFDLGRLKVAESAVLFTESLRERATYRDLEMGERHAHEIESSAHFQHEETPLHS